MSKLNAKTYYSTVSFSGFYSATNHNLNVQPSGWGFYFSTASREPKVNLRQVLEEMEELDLDVLEANTD